MAGRNRIRVVVTGVGVVSQIGTGNDNFWDSLIHNRSGIDFLQSVPSDGLPSAFGAEVRDFNPANFLRDKKFVKLMTRAIQLGVASSNLAVKDSGVLPGTVDPYRFGVVYGCGRMTCHPGEIAEAVEVSRSEGGVDINKWGQKALNEIAPLWLLRQLPNMPASHVSIDHNACGPNNTITCRDASA